MKVTLDIPEDKFQSIEIKAKELGLTPADLLQSLLNDQISKSKEDFTDAMNRVLDKNAELYKRLS